MARYNIIKEVGDGTFGSVWRALNKKSGEVVAIKRMKKKYYSCEECVNQREFQECNLYQLMKDKRNYLSEAEVRNWCFQLFQGLAYIHQLGYFHRDMKPGIDNVLTGKVKLIRPNDEHQFFDDTIRSTLAWLSKFIVLCD